MSSKRLRIRRKIDTAVLRGGTGVAVARSLTRKLPDTPTSPLYDGLVKKRTASNQLQDPFRTMYGLQNSEPNTHILEPAYDPGKLIMAALSSSALNQCIDAYVTNIESYGYQLEYIGETKADEQSEEAQAQKYLAMSFCDAPGGDKTLREVRENTRRDLEYTGNRYFEIGLDRLGRPTFMDHVPSPTMRMTRKDKDATEYEVLIPNRTGAGFTKRKTYKHFRRYVQVTSTGQKVFFKEFGDPRPIDPKTGKVDYTLSVEEQATSIYHHALYVPGSPYGVPRWIGALKVILGSQESELVNLNFFRENAIPAMAVLISGGALTGESFDNISNIITAARGKDAMNRILILEAAADESVGSVDNAPPAPKIELKPMISERQQDGLFKEYEDSSKVKIRSTMRLPALYTGDTEEYTKATAQSGQRMAESQVFFPERTLFDEFMNTKILPRLGVYLWRFKSMGPTVYDPESLGTLVDRFARHGALTPNILVKLANSVLDVQIPSIEEDWGDVPFNYIMEMAKQGMVIDGMEDMFATIHDESLEEDKNPETGLPANDNVAAIRKKLVRELRNVSGEIIMEINEALTSRAA